MPHQRQIRVKPANTAATPCRQVELALRLQLPLVLHIRDAEEEGLEVLRAAGLPPYWPVHRHCFTGDGPAAAAWLTLYPGSRLGVTAAVTHPDRRAVHDWVHQVGCPILLLHLTMALGAPREDPPGDRRPLLHPLDRGPQLGAARPRGPRGRPGRRPQGRLNPGGEECSPSKHCVRF